jgi:hypothetical protein
MVVAAEVQGGMGQTLMVAFRAAAVEQLLVLVVKV